jgi:hypothetical protein
MDEEEEDGPGEELSGLEVARRRYADLKSEQGVLAPEDADDGDGLGSGVLLSDLLRERMLLSTSTVAAARSAALESRLHSIRAEDGWVDD